MCASRSPSARYKFYVHGAVKSRGMAVTATGSTCGGTIENVYWHGCFLSMRDGVLIMRVMSRATIAFSDGWSIRGPFSGRRRYEENLSLVPSHPWRQECHLAARMTAPAAAKTWSAPRLRG